MGPAQDNFISWWQLCMLITGQPDIILTDPRNSRGSTQLSAVNGQSSQWCESRMYLKLVLLHIRALGQGMRYSNVTASLLPQPTILAEATITCSLVIPLLNGAFGQSVPSQILFPINSGFVQSY